MEHPPNEFYKLSLETKQHIFSLLRGSRSYSSISLVCQNFNGSIEKSASVFPLLKQNICKIYIEPRVTFEELPSNRYFYPILLIFNATSIQNRIGNFDRAYHILFNHFSNKKFALGPLKKCGLSAEKIPDISNFAIQENEKGPYFCFYIEEGEIGKFLKYIEDLDIKSEDCKVFGRSFAIIAQEVGERFDEANEFLCKLFK